MLRGGQDQASEDEALMAFGLVRTGPAPRDVCEVWPENWRALNIFGDMMTQWTVGMGGPVGLRYEALQAVLDLRSVPQDEREETFSGVQVMESEALRYWREHRG
jgi:hypothetical protein